MMKMFLSMVFDMLIVSEGDVFLRKFLSMVGLGILALKGGKEGGGLDLDCMSVKILSSSDYVHSHSPFSLFREWNLAICTYRRGQ